jgi:hypothetical protein
MDDGTTLEGFIVRLYDDSSKHISLEHANLTCPLMLKAFLNHQDMDEVNEDQKSIEFAIKTHNDRIDQILSSIKKAKLSNHSVLKSPDFHIDSVQKKWASGSSNKKDGGLELKPLETGLSGGNKDIMGHKRRKEQERKEY